jgi:hypothetical protein
VVNRVVGALLLLAAAAPSASAQNYSFDARRIALGGAGGTPNVASKLVERQRPYRSILIPVGLIRVLSDVRVFFPNREDFDLSRAVQYADEPFHHVFGRQKDTNRRRFFRDLVEARVSPDLNDYRGWDVAASTYEEGLMALNWGKNFTLREDDRSFQVIYVGAGPYLAAQAYADFDSQLIEILNSSGTRYIPFADLGIVGGETDQLAVAITGSYRARFPLFSPGPGTSSRNGMYVAANYHHLQGIRFDEVDANLRLDTDTNGLLTPDPLEVPLTIDWDKSTKGHGLAMDFGVTFVVNRWDFGVGVSGVANRITWKDIEHHDVALASLSGGVEFLHLELPSRDERRIELPVTYTGDLAYHREKWSAYSEYSDGLGGANFRAGLEYRFGWLEARGAGRYSEDHWYPSAGVGINLTRTFGVDLGFYGTETFLDDDPHVGMAISFRWDRLPRGGESSPAP